MKINPHNYKFSLLLLVLLISCIDLVGQNEDQDEGIGLELLDETLFIGGLSPNVLAAGEFEINFYNSLFSSWIALHESVIESRVRDRLRFTDFNTAIETYFGLTRNGRVDLGARIRYGNRRVDNNAMSSVWDVFDKSEAENTNEGFDKSYSGLREVGIRLRMVPFPKLKEFTINAGYSFGEFDNSRDDDVFKIADRNSFDINLSYYVNLNQNSYYYFIVNGTAFQPGSLPENQESLYNTTGSFFLVQRMGQFVLYPGLSYTIAFKPPSAGSFSDHSLIKSSEQLLGTLGIQFQPSNNFSLNLSGSIPFVLTSTNNRQKLVRDSFSFISLGGRIVI